MPGSFALSEHGSTSVSQLLPEQLCLFSWVCHLSSRSSLSLPGFAACLVFQLLCQTVWQPRLDRRRRRLLLAIHSLLPSTEPKKRQCKVLFEYNPVNEDELELKVGNIVDILEEVLQTC